MKYLVIIILISVLTLSVVATTKETEIDPRSFNLGVIYGVRAMESVYGAKEKIGARDLSVQIYFATVQQTALKLAQRDSLKFTKSREGYDENDKTQETPAPGN